MPTSQMSQVIDQLRTVALRDGTEMPDSELLELFVRQRDDAALAALVHRHGPMVWGVCRRVLTSHHDAEDAFQATFLVLVRKAASLKQKELLANWLYGVAQQTAWRARAAAYKSANRERQVRDMPEPSAATQESWDAVQPILDQELSKLPDKYRTLIILCDLEGKSRKDAAQELGCPDGTVAGRLARARTMLAKRLARRGVTVSAGALATLLAANTASATAPHAVLSSTIQAASLYAAGQATASGVISAKALALTEGVLKAMLMTKLKVALAVFVMVCLLGLAGGVLRQNLAEAQTQRTRSNDTNEAAATQREQPKAGDALKGKIGAIDIENRSITLVQSMFDRKAGEATEKETVLKIAKDAVILQDGVKTNLEDLKRGFNTTVKVDQKTALTITVDGNSVKGQFKSMNMERNTITVIAGRDMGEKIYHLLKTTKVTTAGGKAGKVQDLQPGAEIQLTLSVLGDNSVIRIEPTQVEKKKRGER